MGEWRGFPDQHCLCIWQQGDNQFFSAVPNTFSIETCSVYINSTALNAVAHCMQGVSDSSDKGQKNLKALQYVQCILCSRKREKIVMARKELATKSLNDCDGGRRQTADHGSGNQSRPSQGIFALCYTVLQAWIHTQHLPQKLPHPSCSFPKGTL